jgi:hypothetical protein
LCARSLRFQREKVYFNRYITFYLGSESVIKIKNALGRLIADFLLLFSSENPKWKMQMSLKIYFYCAYQLQKKRFN